MNRKEGRKAKSMARKPLIRPGVPIHSAVAGIRAPDGVKKFYWFATEDYNRFLAAHSMEAAELLAAEQLHGPFDTAEEADEAAKIAIVGKDCEFRHGGMWDPAWSK